MAFVPTVLRGAALRASCALAFCLAASAQVPPEDPFAQGLRWKLEPEPAAPWIPRELALAAEDLVWIAGEGQARRLVALPLDALLPGEPLLVDAPSAAGIGALAVAAGARGRRLFSAAQLPDPDSLHRRTRIAAHDPLSGASGLAFEPAWTHDLLHAANGPVRLACDRAAELVLAAAFDGERGLVRIERLEGLSGAVLARLERAAPSLGGMALSEDGSRAFLVLGTTLLVLDDGLDLLWSHELGASTRALAPTADGRGLLVGGLGGLTWCADGAAGWAVKRQIAGRAGELAASVACSADGSTWAVGWWRYLGGTSLRFELVDGESGARLLELVQDAPAGAPQNLPQVVRISRDGTRAALGAWGGGGEPELVVVERDPPRVLFSADLPGSVEALVLDERGERVVVASKAVHANQLGGAGSVRAYELGGRDLVQLAPARAGRLELAARGPAGAICLFLVGSRRASPVASGPLGGLWLEREARTLVVARVCDAEGVARLELDLPGASGLAGRLSWGQALFRAGGRPLLGRSLEAILFL